jgi:hypothetical protein
MRWCYGIDVSYRNLIHPEVDDYLGRPDIIIIFNLKRNDMIPNGKLGCGENGLGA